MSSRQGPPITPAGYAALKARYAGQMDFGQVGPLVKDRLAG